tara:strand:+ start:184 stop:519 length:336 start_codon:yes stop_codon:yes gene_type:complete
MAQTIDEVANAKRAEFFALNQSKFGYNETEAYSYNHPNAQADGDNKGRGNSAFAGGAVGGYAAPADSQVGTGIDVEKRDEAISYNEGLTGMSPETPYTGPELSEYPYQSNP